MTIQEMIKKYDMRVTVEDGIEMIQMRANLKDAKLHRAEIIAAKAEIIAEIKGREAAEEKARQERRAKVDAIEGLNEIRAAIEDANRYHREFTKMMEDEYNDGVFSPKQPTTSVDELKAKYPRAAAYLMAQSYEMASNYAKSGAGCRALERIINGEDHETVIAEMESEWSDHCMGNVWN